MLLLGVSTIYLTKVSVCVDTRQVLSLAVVIILVGLVGPRSDKVMLEESEAITRYGSSADQYGKILVNYSRLLT